MIKSAEIQRPYPLGHGGRLSKFYFSVILACGPLTPPDNGNLAVSVRNVFPSVAQFSCDGGYTVVGSSVLMCTQDGSWNDTSPTCIQGKCLGVSNEPYTGGLTALLLWDHQSQCVCRMVLGMILLLSVFKVNMSLVVRKPVFWVFDLVPHKPRWLEALDFVFRK